MIRMFKHYKKLLLNLTKRMDKIEYRKWKRPHVPDSSNLPSNMQQLNSKSDVLFFVYPGAIIAS